MCLLIDHFAQTSCQSLELLQLVHRNRVNTSRFWKFWRRDSAFTLWWRDAPELQLAKPSPYWWMGFIVFWITHTQSEHEKTEEEPAAYAKLCLFWKTCTFKICLYDYSGRVWDAMHRKPKNYVKALTYQCSPLTLLYFIRLWYWVHSHRFWFYSIFWSVVIYFSWCARAPFIDFYLR